MSSEERQIAQSLIKEFLVKCLREHDYSPRWWYHLQYIKGSTSNLADYLGLTKEQYHCVMHRAGMMRPNAKSKTGFQVNHLIAQKFAKNSLLDNQTCFEHTAVDHVCGKIKLHWLGLGVHHSTNKYGVSDQWTDKANQIQPNRLTRIGWRTVEEEEDAEVRFEALANWLADIDNQETKSNLSTAADDKLSALHLQTPPNKTTRDHNTNDSTPTSTSPYLSPLRTLQACLTKSPVEVEKGSAIQIAISMDNDTKTREDIATIIRTIVPTVFAHGDEEAEIEVEKAKYPILHALGVPLRNSLMSRLLGELVAL
jgi:hypothetical protein